MRMSSYALARSLAEEEEVVELSKAVEAVSTDDKAWPIAASTTFAVRVRQVIWESVIALAVLEY